MYEIYGEEPIKEAFGGILPQPIEVFEYVNKWLPGKGELVLKAKNGRDGFKTDWPWTSQLHQRQL